MSPAWIELNVNAEYALRKRLKSVYGSAVAELPPLRVEAFFDQNMLGSGDPLLPMRQQHACYLYFAASSAALCCTFDDEHDLSVYRDKLCSLSEQPYLDLCAATFAYMVTATERWDRDSAAFSLDTAAAGFGQRANFQEYWLECLVLVNDEQAFLSEASLRLYKRAATILGLPTDRAALETARNYSKWNGIACLIWEDFLELDCTADYIRFVRHVLS